jgi:hypothetical protein
MPRRQLYGLLAALGLGPQLVSSQINSPCNPRVSSNCPIMKGLPSDHYYIDFTKETSLPANWILADYEYVNFSSKGAQVSRYYFSLSI